MAIEEIELDRVGLGGGGGAGDWTDAAMECLSNDKGADAVVGVGTGVGCAEAEVETVTGDGWCSDGTWPL